MAEPTSPTFKCGKCSDTGLVGCDPETYDLPEGVSWKDREYCSCAEGQSSYEDDQAEARYRHQERCFTDHGYARGN